MKGKIRSYILSFSEKLRRLRIRAKIVWWRICFDITVGPGTDFEELRYLNTDQGPIRIGKNCRINALALAGPIEIGDNVLVNLYSDISGRDYAVKIGNNVLIAPHVAIMASQHNYQERNILIRDQGTSGADVVIEDDVWIGTNVVILPGVHIERGAVIGANAVVTRNIPAFAVAIGMPAQIVKFRD